MANKLADPQGMIRLVKGRLPKNCSIRKNKYCEHIIAMRLQGVAFHKIADWLEGREGNHRIPSATLWRNFKKTQLKVSLTWAEELIEKYGGEVDIDLVKEMTSQILTQKVRIDKMVRGEKEKQKGNSRYMDRRIRQEMETLQKLLVALQAMKKTPQELMAEAMAADALENTTTFKLTDAASEALTQLILEGAIEVGLSDTDPNDRTIN